MSNPNIMIDILNAKKRQLIIKRKDNKGKIFNLIIINF